MTKQDWLKDALIVGIVAVVGILGSVGTDAQSTADTPVDALAIGIMLAAALALFGRRRWPLVTLALTTAAAAVYLGLSYPYGPIFIPFFVAVYTVAATRPFNISVPAAGLSLLPLLVHLFTHPSALPGFLGLIPASAWVAVPFALGSTMRLSRESRAREQEDAIVRRIADERLRIAQEVHDVVGHGLAAIKMRADVALHVIDRNPEEAQLALRAISLSSTEALGEIRSAVELIRGDREPGVRPGLHRIGPLLARIRGAGVVLSYKVIGTQFALPESVDAAVFRVIQEALTNVLKHAEPKEAMVAVRYEKSRVEVSVISPTENVHFAPGFGITGMRDRVESLGGAFNAEARDGRFVVEASIEVVA